MRRSHSSVFVIVLAFVVALVSPASIEAQPAPPAKKVIMPVLPPGTSWYTMGVGLSQLVNKNTDIMTVVEPVTSPIAFHDLLKTGEAHLMIEQADIVGHAYRGQGGGSWIWPGPKQAYTGHRLLMGLNNNYYGFVTAAFTGITTIPDLKNKRVGMLYPPLPLTLYAKAMLRAYGLDPEKDVKALQYPFDVNALSDLGDKKLDAVAKSLGGAKIIEVDSKVKIRWLPFDPGRMGVVQQIEPQIQSGVAQTYIPGVKEPTPVISIRLHLIADKAVPDAVGYHIVKVICERAKELVGLSWEFREWTKERAMILDPFYPYHPGAIQYFKEQGMWTDGLEGLQKRLLAEAAK